MAGNAVNTTLVILLGLAVVIIAGLFYFYSPFTTGEGQITLKLGPGNCIDNASCKAYCETHLQDCIDWCTENEHVLCGAMASEYLGNGVDAARNTQNNNVPDDGVQNEELTGSSGINNLLGPGGCLGGDDCVIYCQQNLQDCIDWCESNEHALCEILTNQYIDGN